jgi:hypothetical protein
MRILLTAALAASLVAGTLPALAETAKPVAEKACKTFKKEGDCPAARCDWSTPGDAKGLCKNKAKPKTT